MSVDRLVIGVGSPDRGDDAVGLEAVRRIGGVDTAAVTDCTSLIELWDGRGDVVVIDGMLSGAQPGSVTKLDAIATDLPEVAFTSTHAFDLGTAVSISRILGRLPAALTVYGIEVEDVSPGNPLTASVRGGLESVLAEIEERS